MNSNPNPIPIPQHINQPNHQRLEIQWQDGHQSHYQSRSLRLACPCAHCVDEVTGIRTLKEASVPQDVYPENIALVGKYAIEFKWTDGHETGIYTYEYLRKLCECEGCQS